VFAVQQYLVATLGHGTEQEGHAGKGARRAERHRRNDNLRDELRRRGGNVRQDRNILCCNALRLLMADR
jgi:hypothetical protein